MVDTPNFNSEEKVENEDVIEPLHLGKKAQPLYDYAKSVFIREGATDVALVNEPYHARGSHFLEKNKLPSEHSPNFALLVFCNLCKMYGSPNAAYHMLGTAETNDAEFIFEDSGMFPTMFKRYQGPLNEFISFIEKKKGYDDAGLSVIQHLQTRIQVVQQRMGFDFDAAIMELVSLIDYSETPSELTQQIKDAQIIAKVNKEKRKIIMEEKEQELRRKHLEDAAKSLEVERAAQENVVRAYGALLNKKGVQGSFETPFKYAPLKTIESKAEEIKDSTNTVSSVSKYKTPGVSEILSTEPRPIEEVKPNFKRKITKTVLDTSPKKEFDNEEQSHLRIVDTIAGTMVDQWKERKKDQFIAACSSFYEFAQSVGVGLYTEKRKEYIQKNFIDVVHAASSDPDELRFWECVKRHGGGLFGIAVIKKAFEIK